MANCRFKHVCFILQIAVIAGCPDVLMHGPSSDTLRRLLPRFSGDRTDGHVQSSTGRESAAADRVQDFPPVDVISINHLYCSRHGTVAALAARMPKDIRAAMWNHHFSGSGGGMANCRFKHVCFILQIAVIAGCPDVLMHGPSSDTLRRLLPRFSGDRTDGHVQSSTGRESAAADRVQDFPPVDVISINHLYCSRHGTVAALAARMPKDIRAAMWNHHFSGSGGGMANCRFKHVCFILQVANSASILDPGIPPPDLPQKIVSSRSFSFEDMEALLAIVPATTEPHQIMIVGNEMHSLPLHKAGLSEDANKTADQSSAVRGPHHPPLRCDIRMVTTFTVHDSSGRPRGRPGDSACLGSFNLDPYVEIHPSTLRSRSADSFCLTSSQLRHH
ncbi:hypothetical protein MRX96_031392 [Rhipicephalus microplus]